MYRQMPVGWRISPPENPDYMDRMELCTEIGKRLWKYPDLTDYVWKSICADVDGAVKDDFPEPYERWQQELDLAEDHDAHDTGHTRFCLEIELPFNWFWEIAQKDSEQNIRNGYWHQTVMFGYETWDSIPF